MSSSIFTCGSCGRKYPWKPESAGKQAKCKCGQLVTVPRQPEAPAAQPAPEAQPMCPSCGQPLEPGAVLCLNCGYNTKTGDRLGTEVVRSAATAAVPAATPDKPMMYPENRRRGGSDEKESGGSTKLYIFLGGGLLLVAMAVGGYFIFKGTGGGDANKPKLGQDAEVEGLIADQTATDLGEWIKANPARMLHHRTPGQAIALEEQLKKMGAKRVLAFGSGVLTMAVGIELPDEPAKRKELFDWYDRDKEPGDPRTADVGQRYLLYRPQPK